MEAPEFERWNKLAAELHDAFRSARPYPHVVIDDFLPSDLVDPLADEFSHIGGDAWKHTTSTTSASSRSPIPR